MWSNARGCPRVNGGGPLAVLATSVCSGRGGRRLVFWCPKGGARLSQGGAPPHTPPRRSTRGLLSQGGAPPHTPPRRSTRGFLGLGWQAGGCAGWAAGFPRRLLALIRARGARAPLPRGAAPSGVWCFVSLGRACAARRSGPPTRPRIFSMWGAAPPTPPLVAPSGVGMRHACWGLRRGGAGWALGRWYASRMLGAAPRRGWLRPRWPRSACRSARGRGGAAPT